MKQLPITTDSAVLRTDFSDQATWNAICAEIQAVKRVPLGEAVLWFGSFSIETDDPAPK